MRASALLLLFLACFSTADVVACRYNVRDTAFVDLGDPPYTLVFRPGETLDDAQRKQLRHELDRVLADSNVALQIDAGNAGHTGDVASFNLVAADGRRLPLQQAQVSVENVSLLASRLFMEPQTIGLIPSLLYNHSVVLVVEGSDAQANKQVHQAVNNAAETIQAASGLWPKAIDGSVKRVTLRYDQRSQHVVLLWSLGVDRGLPEPQVVVLFGRGRRLGEPLSLADLAAGKLEKLLGIVSMDCECEYDVAPFVGPMIPHRWDENIEREAAPTLGFDPGHPLVITEVRQILFRKGTGETHVAGSKSPLENPLFGYQEIALPPVSAQVEARSSQSLLSGELTSDQDVEVTNVESVTDDVPAAIAASIGPDVEPEPNEARTVGSILFVTIASVGVLAIGGSLLIIAGKGRG